MKPIYWIGSSLADLRRFPKRVRSLFGYALYVAQRGDRHPDVKPLKGFGGAGVLEVIEDCRGDTYRAVYTVRFVDQVYVLHAFKKKSKKGIETPRRELQLIQSRFREAQEHYEQERRR